MNNIQRRGILPKGWSEKQMNSKLTNLQNSLKNTSLSQKIRDWFQSIKRSIFNECKK